MLYGDLFSFKNPLVYGMGAEAFKSISLPGKIIQDLGQDKTKIAFGLEAVVENDDAAFTGIVQYISEALFTGDFLVEIAAKHIPHDDPVMALQKLDLARFQAAEGRTEQGRMHKLGTVPDIVEIRNVFRSPAIDVIVGVISHGMAFVQYPFKNIRVLADIVTHREKSGFGLVFFKFIKDPGRYFGNWPVIKSQEQDLLPGRNLPDEIGEEILDYFWSLN